MSPRAVSLPLAVVAVVAAMVMALAHDARAMDSDRYTADDLARYKREDARRAAEASTHEPSANPVDFEMALRGSYLTAPVRGATTPFGFGAGGRFGLVISGFYLGLSGVDFAGGSDGDVQEHAILLGAELGYGLRIVRDHASFFTLRPLIGLGSVTVSRTDPRLAKVDVVTTASGRSSSTTSDTIAISSVYLAPGLAAMFTSGYQFIALRGDVLVVPKMSYGDGESTGWLSYGLGVDLGLRF